MQQNYFRADTLTEANARLVDAQAAIQLTGVWGGGELASVDGLRFVVPVKTINAGPNPKYFGRGLGVTYASASSISGSSPTVAEKRTFGALSVCLLHRRELAPEERGCEDEGRDDAGPYRRRRGARDEDVQPCEAERDRVA